MLWLLDTNIVSELWKPAPNSALVGWLDANRDDCALSEITFGELHYGLHRLSFGRRRNELERRIRFLRQDYGDMILSFGAAEAEAWGQYAAELEADRGKQQWTARTMRDSALAATARAWHLTVVTRDTGGFPHVATLNPFSN